MVTIKINKSEEGTRLDRYLKKYLRAASSGFVYKMLRKKNILLNDKKTDGSRLLEVDDIITIYLADDTLDKMRGNNTLDISEYLRAYESIGKLDIAYEDDNVVIINKPINVLSQRSGDDISINEWLIGYMISKGEADEISLNINKPAICNRLDRNTTGLLIGAKNSGAARIISRMIKEQAIRKIYIAMIVGCMRDEIELRGYLDKDKYTNTVHISDYGFDASGDYIETHIRPISFNDNISMIEVELKTGKPHQIRAHLAHIGHPIIGDIKYGIEEINKKYYKYGIRSQMLCSYRIIFPSIEDDEYGKLSELSIEIKPPNVFYSIL